MPRPNILVTGGAGFIGSHLCDALLDRANVICLDNLSTGQEGSINHLLAHPAFEFIKHDITQPIDLAKLEDLEHFQVRALGIQEIYHLACPTSPRRFNDFRLDMLRVNSMGTLNVLELAKIFKSKVLFASSSVVYGPREEQHRDYVVEDDHGSVNALSARACYDEGKRFAETCMETYKKIYGLDTRIVRLFRLYGPRMPIGEGHMIPDFILSALENEPLTIYGDKMFASSLCYIEDAIDAMIKLMQLESLEGSVNIGGDQDMLLAEVAQKVLDLTKSKSTIKFEPPMLFLSSLTLPDITKAKELIGWFPVTTLEKGLAKTIEYDMAQHGEKNIKNPQ